MSKLDIQSYLFNQMYAHMIRQGECSAVADKPVPSCRYRMKKDDKTLMCAVGFLLRNVPDDEISNLEGKSAREPTVLSRVAQQEGISYETAEKVYPLLIEFQLLHDDIADLMPHKDNYRYQELLEIGIQYIIKEFNFTLSLGELLENPPKSYSHYLAGSSVS